MPLHPPQVSVKRQDVDKAIAHLSPEKQNWAKGILNSTNGPGGKSVSVTPQQMDHFLKGLDANERSQFLKAASDSRTSVPMDPSRIKVMDEKSHASPRTPASPAPQTPTRPAKSEDIPVNLHADQPDSKGAGLHRRNAVHGRRPSADGAPTKTETQAKPQQAPGGKPGFENGAQAMPSTFSPFNASSQPSGDKPQAPVSTPTTQAPPSTKPTQGTTTAQSTPAPASTQSNQTPASTQANQAPASAHHNGTPAASHHDAAPPSAGEQFLSKLGFSSKIVAGIAAFAVAVPILSVLFAKTSPSDTSAGTPGKVE